MDKILDQVFKVAIYLRLSKEDGDLSNSLGGKSESNSISNQRLLIYNFLKNHPELQVYDEYKDDGISGTTFDRAEFQRMIDDIEAGNVNCVIVKDQSRFGRDYIEVGKYKEKIFPKLGVRFITINEGYDSLSATSSDDLAFTINSFVYDLYSRDLSNKIRSNLKAKKETGAYASNYSVFGYEKNKYNKNKLVPDPYAAEIVQDIFRWKIDGLSPQSIAERLTKLGVPSPAEYKKIRGSKYKTNFQGENAAAWSHVAVRRILRNEIYIGVTIQGKRTSPNFKTKKKIVKPESEWFRVEDTHEPIISVKDFNVVQELLKEDTRCNAGNHSVGAYSGRIFCGDCGAPAVRKTVSSGGKQYVYYVCGGHKLDKSVCSSHTIKEEILDQAVFETVKHHIAVLLDVDAALRHHEAMAWEKHKLKKIEKGIEVQNEIIHKNSVLRLGIYEDFQAELLDRSEYEALKEELTERIASAAVAIELLNKEKKELLEGLSAQQAWIEQFRQYKDISELTRKTVINLVDRINIFEDSKIEIVFRHQDEINEIITFLREKEKQSELMPKIISIPRLEVV